MTAENPPPSLDAFLSQYWRDREGGQVRQLGEYLREFPGAETAISTEYEELEAVLDAPADQSPMDSDVVGNYLLVRELARGGQGTVFLARHIRLGRPVALKILRSTAGWNPQLRERFRREAEVASKLDHPGICPVFEAGESEDTLWIAMRYVRGVTLASRISAGCSATTHVDIGTESGSTPTKEEQGLATPHRREVTEMVQLLLQVAHALDFAHAHGVVHRDVKPDNIMIEETGRVILLDFGIASTQDSEQLTAPGDVFGTPAYMSPEQLTGANHAIGPTADVWALGVSLYQALTLRLPFGSGGVESVRDSARCEPIPLRRHNRVIDRDLQAVCLMALTPEPERRYQTAGGFADDLTRWLDGRKTIARPTSTFGVIARQVKRRPKQAIAGCIIAALAALTVLVLINLEEDQRQLETRVSIKEAFIRWAAAVEAGRTPDPGDVDTLVRAFDDESIRSALKQSRSAELERIRRLVLERLDPEAPRCMSPVGRVTTRQPLFRIWLPPHAAPSEWVLSVLRHDEEVARRVLTGGPSARPRTVALAQALDYGDGYSWSIGRRDQIPDDTIAFSVEPESRCLRALSAVTNARSGDAVLDVLRRVATLLREGFYQEALDEFAELRIEKSSAVRDLADILQARVLLRLRDWQGFEALVNRTGR